MNKKINLLLLSLLVTFSVFIYLSLHHYSVKLGLSENAICSISAKINCDAAATSSYAEVLGIPVAILGGIFSLFLFGLVLFIKMDWVNKSAYTLTTLRFMLSISALVSLVMGLISLIIIKVICPFCTATYILSFINLYLGWNLFVAAGKIDFKNYFSEYKSHLIFLICIPVVAWMVSGMALENYGLSEITKLIPEKINQWKNGVQNNFNLSEGLVIKGTTDKITLVEFADFKCPHCKAAAKTVDLFVQGNPDVTFVFKPYPLDGVCNKAMTQKGDGTRCTMAAWALCAEKTQKRGWDVHHWLFEKQEELFQVTDLKTVLGQLEKDLNIDVKSLTDCSDSNETYELLSRVAGEGSSAQVEGTPTMYMNGKKLPLGQLLDVLKAAAKEVR
jgi:protein-disulfide isomerase/uncharacterized membrane protein